MMSLPQIMQLEQWQDLQSALLPVQTALYRAEYDVVSREELQAVKAQVLPLLLEVAGLQEEMPEEQG